MEASTPHDAKNKQCFGHKVFWCGLVLACLGLFAALSDGSPQSSMLGASRAAPRVVNATGFDGPLDQLDSGQLIHHREMRELRDRIKALETELATLKRQNRTP